MSAVQNGTRMVMADGKLQPSVAPSDELDMSRGTAAVKKLERGGEATDGKRPQVAPSDELRASRGEGAMTRLQVAKKNGRKRAFVELARQYRR